MSVHEKYGSKRAKRPVTIRENKYQTACSHNIAADEQVVIAAPGTGKRIALWSYGAGTNATQDGGFGGYLSGTDGVGVAPSFVTTKFGPTSVALTLPKVYPSNSAVLFSKHGLDASTGLPGSGVNLVFVTYTIEDE